MSNVQPFQPRRPARERVLCLHSSASSGRQWRPMIDAWAGRFEVLAPELLGYGGGERWPTGTPVSLDAEAQALAPLLQRQPVHLVGHSYGGAVALQIALRWPDRVSSLTLYEPVRFALLSRNPATQAAGEVIVGIGRRIGMQVLSGRLHAAAERFVDYWSGEGTWAQLDERRRAALAERMPKVQAEFEALFADRVPAAAYDGLTMPVQLIGGSRSPLPARQVLDVLSARWPHAVRTTLAGLGHMGPVDAPLRVLAATAASPGAIGALPHAA
ncbi:MAG TPA: alpha/beta fold hydrolase [Burkholderiaceae bacterium]|nr:alpha/beta fold hydrolase [Burkholderiaceae bacterium]